VVSSGHLKIPLISPDPVTGLQLGEFVLRGGNTTDTWSVRLENGNLKASESQANHGIPAGIYPADICQIGIVPEHLAGIIDVQRRIGLPHKERACAKMPFPV